MRHSRIGSLDVLRSFAVLWVVSAHTTFFPGGLVQRFTSWGSLGVNLFFVLSGFLIGSQWFGELAESGGRGSYPRFFLRRAFRIWPNYYVLLLLFIVYSGGITGAGLDPLWRYLFFAQNFFPSDGFAITWSLCVEEHFYLIFPLLSAFAFRGGEGRARLCFVLVLLLGFLLRAGLWLALRPDMVALASPEDAAQLHYNYFYHPTFTRLDGLLFGVAIAAAYRFRPDLWKRLTGKGNLWLAASVATFFLTVALSSESLGRQLPSFLLAKGAPAARGFLAMTLGGSGFDLSFGFLVMAALSPACLLYRLRSRFTEVTALLSFAIYLTHSEVVGWLEAKAPVWGLPMQGWIGLTVTMAAVYGAAALLYGLIEKPCLILRDRVLEKFRWLGKTA
ncbi:MAG TPA: acyltransferase [Bdellovibrionota bacterium]|jgi:peptidoglycan/LPS O-acetylase OafA/YrhL